MWVEQQAWVGCMEQVTGWRAASARISCPQDSPSPQTPSWNRKCVKECVRYIQERHQHTTVSTVCLACLTVPGERICDLGLRRFGRLVEAIDSSVGLIHGLVVKAAAVKIRQLLPVILFIFIWVIVVGADHVVPYTRMRFLGLRGSRSRK